MSGLWARLRDDKQGSGYIGAFLVLFAVLTLGGVGVLVDSARIAAAERHTSSAAYEAARAGAQAIDVGARRDGIIAIDPTAARAAALAAASGLLADSNATITAVAVDGDEVVVTVTSHVDPWFPVISGRTVTETGRARLVAGITEEGQ